jgi:biofilm PGA synthesis lipoprotein PgaB
VNAKQHAKEPLRFVQVDLDYVYDADPVQEKKNLSLLVTRIQSLGVNTVFLQAFANPEGDGLARELYFTNDFLPVKSDLFARTVNALKTQAHVRVFGWLPVLSFNLDEKLARVQAWNPKTNITAPDDKAYSRLSPFDKKVRQQIVSLYVAMAKAAPIDGILFHDDALLSDFEDASDPALAAYHHAGLPGTIKAIRAKPLFMRLWTKYKTEVLTAFTQDLARHVRAVHPQIMTARNIYAPVALQPESQDWFAQNYKQFLKSYDYTAVMAMPRMENVPDDIAQAWMDALVRVCSKEPHGLQKTLFELQAVDWRKQSEGSNRAIPTEALAAQMRALEQLGARNFGYYPDDFVTNTPDAAMLRNDFSLQTNMYAP